MFLKKMITLVICMFCLLNLQYSFAESTIVPMAQSGTTLNAYISTSGSTVSGRGKCTTLTGYTSTVNTYIQKCVNGTWISISSNSGSSSATVSAHMESGYSYRVYTTCRVYDSEGVLFDSDYAFSGTVYY
jgi:hypothetical protein